MRVLSMWNENENLKSLVYLFLPPHLSLTHTHVQIEREGDFVELNQNSPVKHDPFFFTKEVNEWDLTFARLVS